MLGNSACCNNGREPNYSTNRDITTGNNNIFTDNSYTQRLVGEIMNYLELACILIIAIWLLSIVIISTPVLLIQKILLTIQLIVLVVILVAGLQR